MEEKEYEENADSFSNLELLSYNNCLHLKLNGCNFYGYTSVLYCSPFMSCVRDILYTQTRPRLHSANSTLPEGVVLIALPFILFCI